MQCFKGLISKNLLADDIFNPVHKKLEEYRRTTQIKMDYFKLVFKTYDTYCSSLQKLVKQTNIYQIPDYYTQLLETFDQLSHEYRKFCDRIGGSFKQILTLCGVMFTDYSNLILKFQQLVRNYQSHEQILLELSKRYFRSLKNLQNSIEAYKASFCDVKLIYNNDEKTKRYNVCQNEYQIVSQDYANVAKQLEKLNNTKEKINKQYENIPKQLEKTLKAIANRGISEAKNFYNGYCLMLKQIITYFADKKIELDKINYLSIFKSMKQINPVYFTKDVNKQQYKQSPPLLFYHKFIKQQYLTTYSKQLVYFAKQVSDQAQKRKLTNKKILQFLQNTIKVYEKNYLVGLKDIMSYFQKNKKKITELFGARLVSFIKSVNFIIEISNGLTEKLVKKISPQVAKILALISQDNKTLELLTKELNTHIDKFNNSKSVKKTNVAQFTQQQTDPTQLKIEIDKTIQFLSHLINGFKDKMNGNGHNIKQCYNALIHQLFLSDNEQYSLTCEYQAIYFGTQQFQTNYKKFETDIQNVLAKQKQFFNQTVLVGLKDNVKITFDSERHKFQQFKKLKKPQVESKNSEEDKNNRENVNRQFIAKQLEKSEAGAKQFQFLIANKVELKQNQDMVASYACGLSDKIVLQGRVYITTQRLCFHSKFNPSTVFFGRTFIQIPKSDIKKIQKRSNAFFINNSISITTINGEIWLTSFSQRDQAYNTLCKTLEFNEEDLAFQKSQIVIQQEALQQLKQDDLQQTDIASREKFLLQVKQTVQIVYKQIHKGQIEYQSLYALKILKQFYCDQQMNINRRNYQNFTFYLKDIFLNKDVLISLWQPNIFDYLNPSNIKKSTPNEFKKKINCIVPIPNSGIPFMPKQANSTQQLSLKIFSKHKWIIIDKVSTSGVPYSDCFQVITKITCQTIKQSVCSLNQQFAVRFIKRPMVAGMIQSKAFQDGGIISKRIFQEIKKYYKNLEKLKSKQNATIFDEVSGQKQDIQNQIVLVQQKYEQLQKEYQKQKKSKITNRKLLLGSLLINIMIMFIWIYW